ncbi:zinc finger, CCHC-type containing protein [Tanacetum coccineum]|uniref:Zinc finger, CCHC-type containing protein n=1 Tax=Tanacetum coccineum TaxID=301880 RepID=A0ABQ5J2R9_9ASTR
MSVVYVLTTSIPEDGGDDATVEKIRKRAKWDNDDYVCRCLILNGMSDSLFDIYQNIKSGKELWDSLEAKYMAEDASSKKFLVSNFTNYKMTDSRPVMEQYNELLGTLGRFTQHKMNMDEAIKVPCIIDKLLPSWKDFKHTLKHKKEELTLVELDSHLHIEESLRAHDSDKPKGNNVVGPQAIVILLVLKLKNLGEKGIKCIFVGYAEDSKTFRLYVIEPNDSVSINSIIESRDAIFDETRFSSVLRPSLRIINEIEDINGSVVPEEVIEEDDSKIFDEVMKSQDVANWKEAINDEMDSIMGNNTWVLANLPPGCKPLGCKWIFNIKLKVDRTIEKFKARLVIQGFKQKSGIDYFDTYAPVARISTIRLLIAMASIHNLIIHQMDVKTSFLNGDLDEEVDLTKEFLLSRFSMKDMREADVILGIRIKHESNEIAISQSHYNEKAISQLEYSRVISCWMYAMTCTRPDIAFVVGKLSKYTSNPGTQHWQAIQRVLKYLKKTIDCRSTYTGYPSVMEGYTDASKKKTCITGSTMESKFAALVAAGKEAECAATLAKAYSQMYNGKSRHLGVRHSMIRVLITNGVISIKFVRSQQNFVDHLTKGLARDLVIKSAKGMRLKSN